jgi:hypothetical protein
LKGNDNSMNFHTATKRRDFLEYGAETRVELSPKLQMKGKRLPVRWALKKWQPEDPSSHKVPMKPA